MKKIDCIIRKSPRKPFAVFGAIVIFCSFCGCNRSGHVEDFHAGHHHESEDLRIRIIGDSVSFTNQNSFGYTEVVQLLLPEHNVSHDFDNAFGTDHVLNNLEEFTDFRNDWDIVHVNCGIWDIGSISGSYITPPEIFRTNVRRIMAHVNTVSECQIWATITPFLEQHELIELFNSIIVEEAESQGVEINDLYSLMEPLGDDFRPIKNEQIDRIHWNYEGTLVLGTRVADCLVD